MRGAALGVIVTVVLVTLAGCQQKQASSAVELRGAGGFRIEPRE